jgi:flagellar biosynthetic protein FliQ
VFFGVMLLGSWIINNITSYMNELWSNFNMYIGRS